MKKIIQIQDVEVSRFWGVFDHICKKIESLESNFQPKEPTQFLTASELRKLLKISKPTEMEWRRKGVIQAYKIGGRIYYKRHEVESCMTQVLNR